MGSDKHIKTNRLKEEKGTFDNRFHVHRKWNVMLSIDKVTNSHAYQHQALQKRFHLRKETLKSRETGNSSRIDLDGIFATY